MMIEGCSRSVKYLQKRRRHLHAFFCKCVIWNNSSQLLLMSQGQGKLSSSYLLISSYFPLFLDSPLRNLNFWFSCLKLSCIHNIILHITDQALTNTVTCYYGSRKKLMSCFLCSFWSEKGEMSHSFTIWGHWDMILETNISECNWSRYLMNIPWILYEYC